MRSAMSGAARERERDVRQRADRHEPDVVEGAARVDDEADGVGAVERGGRRGQVGAVEAAVAVDERGRVRLGDEWTGAAGVHRNVETEQVAHHEGVVRGALERGIAGDGGDADEVRVVGGGHDRHRVVVAGVAVEQHTCLHGPSMSSPVLHPRSDERSGAYSGGWLIAGGGCGLR